MAFAPPFPMFHAFYSAICAFILGLLCVSPPEFVERSSIFVINLGATVPGFKSNYDIPVIVNTFNWLYLVIASGLVGYWLVTRNLHIALKLLLPYLFIGAFFSEVPFRSFNAYAVFAFSMLFFLILRTCNFKIIIDVIQAAFWLELTIATLRLFGMETLTNFGEPHPVFFGTIMQHMRFASLLAIMSPFLLIRSKWYAIPIAAAAAVCTSSGFALSVAAGIVTYFALPMFKGLRRAQKWPIFLIFAVVLPLLALAVYLGRDSWAVAVREGRFPVWLVIIKSWIFDTSVRISTPDWLGVSQDGPFNLKSFLFGHGQDTFYNRFSVYKHDPNPFGQAHNCIIQIPWEIGLFGAMAGLAYLAWLCRRLWGLNRFDLLAGLAIILTNMSGHFPTRMTQTAWLVITYFALCEAVIQQRIRHEGVPNEKI